MKYTLFLTISLCCALPSFGQQILSEASVYFDTDEHYLKEISEHTLSEFAVNLKQTNQIYKIVIEAHTDSRASQMYNTALSQRRAKSVQAYLKNEEINLKDITINIYGENNPSFSNSDEDGMRNNRRVDVKAIAVGVQISELNQFLMDEASKRTQTFTIHQNEKNLIIGQQGTKVYIDENTFVFENGETLTSNEIQVVIKEAYTLEDMMMLQLSTHSEEQLLETGGMVFLQATAEGRILKLQEDKSITIGLPSDRLKDDMQLFDGVQNGKEVEWKATNQGFSEVPFEFTTFKMPDHPLTGFRYFVKTYSNGKLMLNKTQHEYYKKRLHELVLYINLVEPQRPIKPIKPQLENIVYKKKGLKSLFISKKKIEKEIQDRYHRKMKVYHRKLKQYHTDLSKYKIDSTAYPAWIAYQNQRMDIATGKLMKDFDTAFKTRGNLSNSTVQHYFFTQNKMGWINCDRFLAIPKDKKMILTINDNDDEEELVYVLLEERNSCIYINRQNATTFTTGLIPKSAKVTIIALKVKDGKNYIAKQRTVANAQSKYDLNYQLVNSAKELSKLLKL